VNERPRLRELRLADIVAIRDPDHTHGRIYLVRAFIIGVMVHGISRVAGLGPGVTTLLTSVAGNIEPVLDPDANPAVLLDLR